MIDSTATARARDGRRLDHYHCSSSNDDDRLVGCRPYGLLMTLPSSFLGENGKKSVSHLSIFKKKTVLICAIECENESKLRTTTTAIYCDQNERQLSSTQFHMLPAAIDGRLCLSNQFFSLSAFNISSNCILAMPRMNAPIRGPCHCSCW